MIDLFNSHLKNDIQPVDNLQCILSTVSAVSELNARYSSDCNKRKSCKQDTFITHFFTVQGIILSSVQTHQKLCVVMHESLIQLKNILRVMLEITYSIGFKIFPLNICLANDRHLGEKYQKRFRSPKTPKSFCFTVQGIILSSVQTHQKLCVVMHESLIQLKNILRVMLEITYSIGFKIFPLNICLANDRHLGEKYQKRFRSPKTPKSFCFRKKK